MPKNKEKPDFRAIFNKSSSKFYFFSKIQSANMAYFALDNSFTNIPLYFFHF